MAALQRLRLETVGDRSGGVNLAFSRLGSDLQSTPSNGLVSGNTGVQWSKGHCFGTSKVQVDFVAYINWGVLFVGVLETRAPPFGVYVKFRPLVFSNFHVPCTIYHTPHAPYIIYCRHHACQDP